MGMLVAFVRGETRRAASKENRNGQEQAMWNHGGDTVDRGEGSKRLGSGNRGDEFWDRMLGFAT